ncbi:MAG TPA: NAD(P)/FAD-dependent oxidoreductase [Steroidobacteraceae bacterium]
MADVDSDVLIIGAGGAGLAAAAELVESGRQILILEARDRIGGRMWTQHVPGLAAPIEYGAEFIHGYAPATMAFLTKGGKTAIESTDTHWRLNDGELQKTNEFFHDVQRAMRASRALEQRDLSFDEFLSQSKELSPEARDYAKMMAQGFDAADTSRASARAIVAEWTAQMMNDDAPQSHPLGGYESLLSTFANLLRRDNVRLQMQTAVHEVRWSEASVEVAATFLGKAFRARAARAIITLPLGVLQLPPTAPGGVRFTPALTQKEPALQGLASGPVMKINLHFARAFWEELDGGRFRDAAFFHSTKADFPTFWTQMPLRAPLLVAWAGGPRALRVSNNAEPGEIIGRAVAALQTMFGMRCNVADQLEAAYYHDWQQDPFARGAYSYVTVGGGRARSELAAPIANTLFFAGEATDTQGETATVAGALQSGSRAARELLAI